MPVEQYHSESVILDILILYLYNGNLIIVITSWLRVFNYFGGKQHVCNRGWIFNYILHTISRCAQMQYLALLPPQFVLLLITMTLQLQKWNQHPRRMLHICYKICTMFAVNSWSHLQQILWPVIITLSFHCHHLMENILKGWWGIITKQNRC